MKRRRKAKRKRKAKIIKKKKKEEKRENIMKKGDSWVGFLWALAIGVAHSLFLSNIFNAEVPNSFMWETNNVERTQLYNEGKLALPHRRRIPLLPGLEITGTLFCRIISGSQSCGVTTYRNLNTFLSSLLFYFLYGIAKTLHPHLTRTQCALKGLGELLLLPLVQYQFLYCGVLGSTALVLGMYYHGLKRRFLVSALFGLAAAMFNQSNALWIAFVAGVIVLRECPDKEIRVKAGPQKFLFWVFEHVTSVAPLINPFVITFLAVFAFAAANDDYIVSEKDPSNGLVLHLAQVMYFILFSAASLFPTLLEHVPKIFARKQRTHDNVLSFFIQGTIASVIFLFVAATNT